jgi:hypothetical protein
MAHNIHVSVCDTKLLLMAGSGSEPLPFLKYLHWFPVFVKKVISNFFNVFMFLFPYGNQAGSKILHHIFISSSAFIKVTKR